nr:PREDICTED: taste receptor type 2 member 10 [Rhinolophus sinicus]
MLSTVEGLLIFIVVTESILGILGNGFIVLVNCIDCVKNKKFSVIGLILIGLATSRIFLIWIIITDGLLKVFSPDMYLSGNATEYISYSWVIINQSSIGFATSLSVFYFLKIANFSHHIFLWLKGRINRIILLLMGFLLILWSLTFPLTMKIINDHKMNRNTTWTPSVHSSKNEYFTNQILLNLGAIFLFTLSLLTCFLLTISLWRHNRQMQLNVTGFRDPSTEVHVKAMKVLISFIILSILYFIGIAIEISCFSPSENKLLFIFGMAITVTYPSGHSFILILGNSKLKKASSKVVQHLKCCVREKPLRTP